MFENPKFSKTKKQWVTKKGQIYVHKPKSYSKLPLLQWHPVFLRRSNRGIYASEKSQVPGFGIPHYKKIRQKYVPPPFVALKNRNIFKGGNGYKKHNVVFMSEVVVA